MIATPKYSFFEILIIITNAPLSSQYDDHFISGLNGKRPFVVRYLNAVISSTV